MRSLSELKGSASGPCLIIGNGPSLADIPKFVINSYPNFACNFFPVHVRDVVVDHLVVTDKLVMKNRKLWDAVDATTTVFAFARWVDEVDIPRGVVPYMNTEDPIPGFTMGSVWGQYFPTSAHAACWIADYIGYEKFLLVGMDGTVQVRELDGVDDEGRSNLPHFYDPNHEGRHSKLWDIAWGNMYRFMYKKGKEIVNLSTKTEITQLPQEDWHVYFGTHYNRWVWAEY